MITHRYLVISILLICNISASIAQENETEKKTDTQSVLINEEGKVNHQSDTLTYDNKPLNRYEDNQSAFSRMVRVPKGQFKGHWVGFDIGFNSYVNSEGSSNLQGDAQFMNLKANRSLTVSLNFFQKSIGLQKEKNNIGLVIGAGWTFYNYRTDAPYYFSKDPESDITIGIPVEPEVSVTKNKITSSFINIPLLLEFQIPIGTNDHRFFFSAGPYFGVKVSSHTKMVYQIDGNSNKDKSRDNINLNPIQYGGMVRMGYRFIKLYATYNASTLYSANKGPELYPYTIGLSLISF